MKSTRRKRTRESRPAGAGRRLLVSNLFWVPIAFALGIHFYIVHTIARQPLNVNGHPPAARSAIWSLHNDTVHRIGPGADYFAVYHAGHALRQGADPYTLVETPRRTPYFYPFRYLPLVGHTIGYMGIQFTPRTAYRQWIAVLEVFLAGVILAFAMRIRDRRMVVLTACVLLLSSPYFLEIHMGQFTFLTLSLLTIGVLFLERPESGPGERQAGVTGSAGVASAMGVAAAARVAGAVRVAGMAGVAGATLLKVLPLVTIPAFLRRRRDWPAAGLAVGAVLTAAVAYFAGHADEWQTFKRFNFSEPVGGMDSGNYGLVYLVYRLGDDLQLHGLLNRWQGLVSTWHLFVLAVTAVVVFFSRCRSLGVGVAAMVAAHFVSYSQVWEHHMSGVIVIGLLLLHAIHRETAQVIPGKLVVVLVSSLVLLALPTPFLWLDTAKDPRVWDPSTDWPALSRYLLVLSKAAPTAAVYAVSMVWLFRAGFAPPWTRRGMVAASERKA